MLTPRWFFCVQATSAEISVKVKEAEETEAEIDKTREK